MVSLSCTCTSSSYEYQVLLLTPAGCKNISMRSGSLESAEISMGVDFPTMITLGAVMFNAEAKERQRARALDAYGGQYSDEG